MKRTISIALVLIILLNTMGYYGIFLGWHYKNSLEMAKAMDAGLYDQSNSLTLKIAVSIPYMPDQSAFERVNGQFVHEGELYRMVKQKYAKDTLTVVCVKDIQHKKIEQALADYVKTFTDKATDTSPTTKITLSFLHDYLPTSFSIDTASKGWAAWVNSNSYNKSLLHTFLASIAHPPERAS